MDLEVEHHAVGGFAMGSDEGLRDGVLTFDPDRLLVSLGHEALGSLDVEVVAPGERARVAGVLDVAWPYAKVAGSGEAPGFLSDMDVGGSGRAVALEGGAVAVVTDRPMPSSEVIDMSGPGAEWGRFGSTANVVVVTERADGAEQMDYYRAAKAAMLEAGRYLAALCAGAPGGTTSSWGLPPVTGLPRVAYVMQVHSHQIVAGEDEPVFYGDNTHGMLPTVVHPNEILDQGVIAGFWSLNLETYDLQRHPVVRDLMRRHGQDLDFAGVVVTPAYPDLARQQRCAAITEGLLLNTLRVDATVMTKIGGGVPEATMMRTIERCEGRGIPSVGIAMEHMRGARDGETLTVHSPAATSLISAGGSDLTVDLPAMERVVGQQRVYERSEREQSDLPPEAGRDATETQNVRIAEIAGAVSQMGASYTKGVSA